MRSVRNLLALTILLSLVFGLAGCAPSTEEEDTAAADAEAWAQLQQSKEELDAKRQELRDLRAAGDEAEDEEAGEDEGEGEEGEAAEGEGMSREDRIASLKSEVDKMTADFGAELAEFINSQEIYEGEDLTPTQRAAFDMKAEEDVLVAQEYIDKAGNYQKAIDIYTASLLYDENSEILLAAKAKAEELRYMTEDRFAAVKKGMTQDEVKETLGTPQPVNIREYENGVTAWFYPKAERKAAAGVFFREKRGDLKVYNIDFNAVESEEEEEEAG